MVVSEVLSEGSAQRIEADLRRALDDALLAPCPPKLARAIESAVLQGGARVRPQLCHRIFEAAGGSGGGAGDRRLVRAAATSLELLHCASLVHDDLPCFDDAKMRRGHPTTHVAFGEPLAVLAGDALIVIALQRLGRVAAVGSARGLMVFEAVSRSVGPPFGITAGQAWESEDEIDLESYHRAKTGALFLAAAEAGAVAAGSTDPRWRRFGQLIGEAFQVADDLKDALLSPAATGKDAAQDERNGRPSAVTTLGTDGAQTRLRNILRDALGLIDPGTQSLELRALVRLIANKVLPGDPLFAPEPVAESDDHARRTRTARVRDRGCGHERGGQNPAEPRTEPTGEPVFANGVARTGLR